MDITELSELFYELVAPSIPSEMDVEESLQPLVGEKENIVNDILQQVPALWSVSYSLCFAYLANVHKAIPYITSDNLDTWVKEMLGQYEEKGLHFVLARIETVRFSSARLHGKQGLRLDDVHGRLQLYLNGLAGRELPLIASGTTYTDTHSIFVPWELDLLEDDNDAFLLYKFIVSYQWASLQVGTLNISGYSNTPAKTIHPLQDFFTSGSDPLTLMQLYHFFEMVRTLAFLRRELPGLMKAFTCIASQLRRDLPDTINTTDLIPYLQKRLLGGVGFDEVHSRLMQRIGHWVEQCEGKSAVRTTSQRAARDIAVLVAAEDELYSIDGDPLVFQGELRLKEVMAAIQKQRKIQQQQFIETFSSYLADSLEYDVANEDGAEESTAGNSAGVEQEAVLKTEPQEQNQAGKPVYIVVGDQEVELTEELSELTEEIINDLGHLPLNYVNSAVMEADQNRGMPRKRGDETVSAGVQFKYDEWDYRRKGYRKDWCIVNEKPVSQVQSSFVEATLSRYQYQIAMLKRQFEMLKTANRYVYRQKEGDDIDFDAVVESIADAKAGCSPSDNLFIRLLPDSRDIAVLFLVDMSSSTEGWVGLSIKEALILISEAMEMLNDRYGIYGFSGRCRLGCEIFPVKALDEKYSPEIRQRIAGISPKEYTRMGPAIRHMSSLFEEVDATLRLLVVLSDGKPQDYDDYKGDYAIEDTRHALFEAQAAGIHPFCITIDEQAQSYISHMYGTANYIFVDNLKKLPMLMPEIYRTLTT